MYTLEVVLIFFQIFSCSSVRCFSGFNNVNVGAQSNNLKIRRKFEGKKKNIKYKQKIFIQVIDSDMLKIKALKIIYPY